MEIIKVIIPAAGLGTRFLPLTKSVPKEMLPIVNKPAIQYVVEEAIAAGIKHFFMIVNREKQVLSHYFDSNSELESILKKHHKYEAIASLETITKQAGFNYICQSEALGLGHAVSLAHHCVGEEYVAIALPDDIIISHDPGLAQLMAITQEHKASVIAVQEVPSDCISAYGIIGIKKQLSSSLFEVSHVIEKPSVKEAPSNLAIIGRYVLSYKIFDSLSATRVDPKGELQLTDAIGHMLHGQERVFAYKISGDRYDVGTPLGWLKANMMYGFQNPSYRSDLKAFMDKL